MENCDLELSYRKPKRTKNFKIGDKVHVLDLEIPTSSYQYWSGVVTEIRVISDRNQYHIKEDAGGNTWVAEENIDFLPENEKTLDKEGFQNEMDNIYAIAKAVQKSSDS
jgi:hypothetical protein